MNAHGGGADKRGHIGRNPPLDQIIEVFGQGGPLDVELDVALLLEHLLLHFLVQRAHRSAFAKHLEGDALPDVALRPAIVEERFGGPAEHVDEAGSNGEAGGINLRPAARVFQGAHHDNLVALDGHIAYEGRLGAAVVDRAVTDD